MSTQPFQASKLFENSGTSESGWDDWDWVDNSNQLQTSNQNYVQSSPSPATLPVDNQQHQHIATGYGAPQTHDLTPNVSLYNSNQHNEQQQPHQPQPQFQPFPPPHKTVGVAAMPLPDGNANINEHFTSANTTSVNNNINWSANGPYQPPPPAVNPPVNASPYAATYTPPPPLVNPQPSHPNADSQKASFDQSQASPHAAPVGQDAAVNATATHDNRGNRYSTYMHKEHTLTPQWSTESQMSYTSSDRSYSENEPHSRPFSNQSNSDDIHRAGAFQEHTAEVSNAYADYVQVDRYQNGDQAHVGPDLPSPAAVPLTFPHAADNFFHQNLAPPQEFAQPEPQLQHQHPPTFAPLATASPPTIHSSPAPPAIAPPAAIQNAASIPTIPVANVQNPLPPPSLNQTPFANTNPFKRVGQHTHRTSPSVPTPAPVAQANIEAQPHLPQTPRPSTASTSASHHEPTQIESTEVHNADHFTSPPLHSIHNLHDIAPHNDRNQYLQTGHLSEENNSNNIAGSSVLPEQRPINVESTDSGVDNLPPPGLSRYVLGEPEVNYSAQPSDPPPGLDRMIPGTDISAPTHLNLERQADGQDTSAPANIGPVRNTVHFSTLSQAESHGHAAHTAAEHNVTDRNQYLVPGGSEDSTIPVGAAANPNIERVVTGLENDRSQHVPFVVEQQRELVVDGENLNDDTNQLRQTVHQQQPPAEREEPIEGANTMDNIQTVQLPPSSAVGNLTDAESVEALDTVGNPRKYHSNNSTGNDESDKEKPAYAARGLNGRRADERPRKRGDKPDHRYETEDTDYSVRDRRKPRDNRDRNERSEADRDRNRNKDRTDDEARSYRRGERSERGERGERGERSERGDRDRHRDADRERDDKYERERAYRDDYNYRESRYETDGSRYDTEDVRYERSLRRRGDRDREHGKYRDDRADRRYRRDREREGERSDRKTDERYRSRDDPRYSEYESGDYSHHTRGHQKDRRRDRGAGSDREGAAYGGYYPPQTQPAFGYDAYSSYMQQQQYYENLRRTNPHAYAEWYKHYFGGGQYQAAVAAAAADDRDGRESVHSGRSSSKDPERYMYSASHTIYNTHSLSHHRVAHDQFSNLHSSTMLETASQHSQSNHFGSRSITSISHLVQPQLRHHGQSQLDSLAYIDTNAEPERMTPFKYSANHCLASIKNGIMVCVKPKYSTNDITNVVNIVNYAPNDATKRLYQLYPGPLLRGPTHKKQVIEFCQEQIRLGPPGASSSTRSSMASLQSLEPPNKTSYTLMWNLLILLLRQNGSAVGTDIAELLLKNKEEFPYEYQSNASRALNNENNSRHSPESEAKQSNEENASDGSHQSEDPLPLSENEVTEKFRNFLLYGSIIEALDWATDNNLWGHALFLASKMDRRTHANVMMKFANKLSLSDPLQTLYQLMSGRTPSSVTCVQDERWGDWRPHLAMIISNTSQKPDLDRKAITTLGDSLHNRGDLYAAQFCYLMSQVSFGRYCDVNQESHLMLNSSNAVRLILLGSSPRKSFRDFATDEAIMMTEIYEYACSLADENFSIVELQPYKFLLGTRMLDYGLHLKALMYMEQISNHIQKNPAKYERAFVENVFVLADRLKYFDPALEKNLDNLDDDEGLNSSNNSAGPQQWQQDLLNVLGQTQQPVHAPFLITATESTPNEANAYSSKQINDEFAQINQQFSDLNLQYSQQNYYQPEQQPQSLAANVPQEAPQPSIDPYSNHFYSQPLNNQYPEDNQQPTYGQMAVDNGFNSIPYGEPQQQQQPHQQYYQPDGSMHQQQQQEPSPYDQYEAPKPTISMPNSMSSKPGFFDDDSSNQAKPGGNASSKSGPSQPALGDKRKEAAKSSGGGFLGGIWNKLSMKPKNQMILPDDKNPTIVWDPDNKRWINTDQDAVEEESFKPPPKMADLTKTAMPAAAPAMPAVAPAIPAAGPAMPPPATTPMDPNVQLNANLYGHPTPHADGSSNINNIDQQQAAKVPNLQSNMFKMQRNKTLKKSYVDVFNPSGAPMKPIEPILAPTMPMAAPQAGFFVPAPVPNNIEQKNDEPAFYNPNQFGGGYQQ